LGFSVNPFKNDLLNLTAVQLETPNNALILYISIDIIYDFKYINVHSSFSKKDLE